MDRISQSPQASREALAPTPTDDAVASAPPAPASPDAVGDLSSNGLGRSVKRLRKVRVAIVGTVILLAAVLVGVLPGPGFTIIAPIGLAVLATEYVWARKLLHEVQRRAQMVQRESDGLGARTSRLFILPVVALYWAIVWRLERDDVMPSWGVWAIAIPAFVPIAMWAVSTWRIRGRMAKQRKARSAAEQDAFAARRAQENAPVANDTGRGESISSRSGA